MYRKNIIEEIPVGKKCPFKRKRNSPSKGNVIITVGTRYCSDCKYNRGKSEDTCMVLCVCKSMRERDALAKRIKKSRMTDEERDASKLVRRKRYEANREHIKEMAREYAKTHKEERKKYVKRTSDLRNVRNRVYRMERDLLDNEMIEGNEQDVC